MIYVENRFKMSEPPELPSNTSCSSNSAKKSLSRQYLEPTGSITISDFLNVAEKKKGKICPEINHVGPSNLLTQVKSFLPALKAAELSLRSRMDAGEDVDLENIEEDKAHIEMNFEVNEMNNSTLDSSSGSSDSDPDSPPSPAERDNSYTSDSDVDTSSSTSPCSCKSVDCPSSKSNDNRLYQDSSNLSTSVNLRQSNADDHQEQCVDDTNSECSGVSKRKHLLIEDITDTILSAKVPYLLDHKEDYSPKNPNQKE